MDDFNFEGTFPLVVSPGHRVLNLQELQQKLHDNKSQIEQLLLKHGALLFRGFPVNSAKHFSEFITALNLEIVLITSEVTVRATKLKAKSIPRLRHLHAFRYRYIRSCLILNIFHAIFISFVK